REDDEDLDPPAAVPPVHRKRRLPDVEPAALLRNAVGATAAVDDRQGVEVLDDLRRVATDEDVEPGGAADEARPRVLADELPIGIREAHLREDDQAHRVQPEPESRSGA